MDKSQLKMTPRDTTNYYATPGIQRPNTTSRTFLLQQFYYIPSLTTSNNNNKHINQSNCRHHGHKLRLALEWSCLLFTGLMLLSHCSFVNCSSDSQRIDFPEEAGSDTEPVGDCQACRLLVESFDLAADYTATGKHEGGDTSWEERKLKSYADSEVRLVEIQERLCLETKRGKAQCLKIAEDSESEIEHWWFNQKNKNVRLFDFLCINKLKSCCLDGYYGPDCKSCMKKCHGHGDCDGSGTRQGTGDCVCHRGYVGTDCESCDNNHFRISTGSEQMKFSCQPCDFTCEGCHGPGPANCTECRSGYVRSKDGNHCVDLDECENKVCKGNTFCQNTQGSYVCKDCHKACDGCFGYGAQFCVKCAVDHHQDDDYMCRSDEEAALESDDSIFVNIYGRLAFYAVVLAFSTWSMRAHTRVLLIYVLGFIFTIIIAETDDFVRLSQNMSVNSR